VHPVLTYFARQNKVIVTNKPVAAARTIVDRLGIRGYFTGIIGADTTHRKPDTGVLAPLYEIVAPDPKRTLVVGDGVNDILLAKNAGFISCALLNGLSDREDLLALEPDHACERLSELVDLFA
jgi:phosphoglycolate phosphatase